VPPLRPKLTYSPLILPPLLLPGRCCAHLDSRHWHSHQLRCLVAFFSGTVAAERDLAPQVLVHCLCRAQRSSRHQLGAGISRPPAPLQDMGHVLNRLHSVLIIIWPGDQHVKGRVAWGLVLDGVIHCLADANAVTVNLISREREPSLACSKQKIIWSSLEHIAQT
jgi:hypothetical protein